MLLLLVLQAAALSVLEELALELLRLAESFLNARTIVGLCGLFVLVILRGGVAIELQGFAHAWSSSCGRIGQKVGLFRRWSECDTLFW